MSATQENQRCRQKLNSQRQSTDGPNISRANPTNAVTVHARGRAGCHWTWSSRLASVSMSAAKQTACGENKREKKPEFECLRKSVYTCICTGGPHPVPRHAGTEGQPESGDRTCGRGDQLWRRRWVSGDTQHRGLRRGAQASGGSFFCSHGRKQLVVITETNTHKRAGIPTCICSTVEE